MKKSGEEVLSFILNDLKIKAPTFAYNIGVSYQRIFDIQKCKTKNISGTLASKISSKYPQYNISWIISGEGDIYNGRLPDRLDKYISYKGISEECFLRSINMAEFRYVLIDSSNIREDELDAIYANYPDLNPDWLLEGKGEMINSLNPQDEDSYIDFLKKRINELEIQLKEKDSIIRSLSIALENNSKEKNQDIAGIA